MSCVAFSIVCVLVPVQEVRSLTALPKLVELCFADPNWGECPLAGLCNYQTYVLYTLTR